MARGGIAASRPGATAFVARPVTASFITAIDHNIATTVDPVRHAARSVLTAGTRSTEPSVVVRVARATLAVGTLRDAIAALRRRPIRSINSHSARDRIDVDRRRFHARADAPVTGAAVTWQSILLLLAVILVAMLFIVVVVQLDLRRPLRRLDAAVAALGTGDFDAPVSTGSVDEIGRLGASFEAMRQRGAVDHACHRRACIGRDGAQPVRNRSRRRSRTSVISCGVDRGRDWR